MIFDVRNIVSVQSSKYSNTVIDYAKLLDEMLDGGVFVDAVAVDGLVLDERGRDASRIFHDDLRRSGFTVELVPSTNGKGKQDGVDVKIALIAQRFILGGNCDVVELVSGGGDFAVLVEELQSMGARVNVTSFGHSLSDALRMSANDVRILDSVPLVRMPGSQEAA
ncbi:MAG: NYN domain-containing protein [Candidatus Methanomethylophilaceae archaeon]|nr:NYN domain-containing protein [Candidatus Methanomethylophilaceae archaeon]